MGLEATGALPVRPSLWAEAVRLPAAGVAGALTPTARAKWSAKEAAKCAGCSRRPAWSARPPHGLRDHIRAGVEALEHGLSTG